MFVQFTHKEPTMAYSKDPFGMNRRANKTSKSIFKLGGSIISGISKANKEAKRIAERERKLKEREEAKKLKSELKENLAKIKAQEKEFDLQIKEKIKAEKEAERERIRTEKEQEKKELQEEETQYILNGYIKKNLSFFAKYIALSILDDETKAKIESSAIEGSKYIFVHNDVLEYLKNKHREVLKSKKTETRDVEPPLQWHNNHPGINSDEDLPDYI